MKAHYAPGGMHTQTGSNTMLKTPFLDLRQPLRQLIGVPILQLLMRSDRNYYSRSQASLGPSLERLLARALREAGFRVSRPGRIGPDLVVSRGKGSKLQLFGVSLKVTTSRRPPHHRTSP